MRVSPVAILFERPREDQPRGRRLYGRRDACGRFAFYVGVGAGGLEGPGTRWVSLQHPSFPAGCGDAQRAPGRHNQPEKGNLGEASPPQTQLLRKSC